MNDKRLLIGLTINFYMVFQVVMSQTSEEKSVDFLSSFMREKLPHFSFIFANPTKYRLQVIYTQVNRDVKNHPTLISYYYRKLPDEFISPASMVKLPLSLLALERLYSLKDLGVTKDTRFLTDCTFICQDANRKEPLSNDSLPTLSSCLTKALVVSDNDAYNRLYDFVGQRNINHRLWELGYQKSQIIQRFCICDSTANRYSKSFTFYDQKGNVIYQQASRFNTEIYTKPIPNMKVGVGYLDERNHFVKNGMDFSKRNFLPLYQVDDILKRVIFPELYTESKRFKISSNDLDYIRRLIALRPAETGIPELSKKNDYWETCTNYLFYGSEENETIPSNVRIFNIVGQSFGFLSDCAYYTDFANRIEFFLSATIYVNNDNILNDGIYEYKTIGFPFMKQLGQTILKYELQRKVKYNPDLSDLEKLFY